ncbi:MAG TPA: hypothetical protein VMF69_08635 [Gemmataceae bacterium]|nr:hypothetical protein [Gemmataceae bacterium]
MRSKVVRTLALALVLALAGMTAAQQPGGPPGRSGKGSGGPSGMPGSPPKQKAAPEKSKLEEMLAEALKNNPDIRVAAAKLAEADAQLNRARMQVMQKVLVLHAALASQKAEVAYQQKQYERYKGLEASHAISSELVQETQQKLALAKAKLEELEAQLLGLLGKEPSSTAMDTARPKKLRYRLLMNESNYDIDLAVPEGMEAKILDRQPKVNISQADKIRKALQTPVKVDYKDMKLDAILDDLTKKVAGVSFRVVRVDNSQNKISLRFGEALPLSAVLQALSDEFQCSFYVREYGILVSYPNYAPPGAMKVEELLRQKPTEESSPPSRGGGKNPSVKNVEGLVKSVDKGGLLTLSIGSDAGLSKGQTLELFVMPHKPPIDDAHPYGTVRIVEVEAHQAVAQPVGGLKRKPHQGDRIIGQILKK